MLLLAPRVFEALKRLQYAIAKTLFINIDTEFNSRGMHVTVSETYYDRLGRETWKV